MPLAALAATMSSTAYAENADDGASPEILVIGSDKDLLDIWGSVALITREDLDRSRVLTVNDALRQVAGILPRDEEGAGVRPNIGIRGLNPTRSSKVLLLEDGIPLAFAPYGDNASYYHPPLGRFERIEVLKGASQVRFGPQTIGGVINYITPRAPDTFEAKLSAQAGNRDGLGLDARIGGPVLGGRGFINADHRQAAGSRDNQLLRATDLFAKGEWDLSPSQQLTLKASWFRERSDITYSGVTRAEFAAAPRGNPFPRGNDIFNTDRYGLSAAHGWSIANGVDLKTVAYWQRFDRDWWRQSSNSTQRPNDASDPLCGGMANLLTTCGNEGRIRNFDTWGIETRITIDHREGVGLGIGGQTEIGIRYHDERQRRRQLNGDTAASRVAGTSVNGGLRENQIRNATALSGFVQSTLALGKLSLIPGVRVESIDYRRRNLPIDVIVGGRPSGALTTATSGTSKLEKIVPGVGATFDVAKAIVVYGGIHRGFAPPRVEDVITTAGGSVDLDAELSWNWEFGVRGTLVRGIYADATYFVMDFENQIVPQSVAGGTGATLTSAGRTLHRGGELAVKASSLEAGLTTETDFFARVAATWVQTARYASTRIATVPCFDGRAVGSLVATGSGPVACGVARDVEGNRLPYSPRWLLNAAVGLAYRGFTGQFELVGQSAMFADDVNLVPVTPDGQRGRIAGWTTANLAVSYGPPKGKWEVFASIHNVFDRLTIVDRSRGILPGVPRTARVGVTIRM